MYHDNSMSRKYRKDYFNFNGLKKQNYKISLNLVFFKYVTPNKMKQKCGWP